MSILSTLVKAIHDHLSRRDAEIERLYVREDRTLAEIANESGMHQSSISRILHKRGVDLYGPGRPSAP